MHLLVAAYMGLKPAAAGTSAMGGEAAAVTELSTTLPVLKGGPRLDTSAWDARSQSSTPLEVTNG